MTEFLPIYVPVADYPEALRQVSSLLTRAESPIPAGPQAAASPADEREWSEDLWRTVWPALHDKTRSLLVVLAEHPDEWVPITELEDSLGSFAAVQGGLSSLTKRLKKFGRTDWPFKVEVDSQTGRARYQMDDATASIVLGLARGA